MSLSLEFVLIHIELENDFVKEILNIALKASSESLASLLNARKFCCFFSEIKIYTSDSFCL